MAREKKARLICTGIYLKDDGTLYFVKNELQKVMRVWELREQGFTYQEICDQLGYNGKGSIGYILENTKYKNYYELVHKVKK